MNKRNERAISLDILEEILTKKAYNNIAINLELNKYDLEKRQRALITELTNGVLRNLIYIDYVISQFSKTPIEKLKPAILNILRQAVYQALFMNTADYAVCSEAVELTKARGLQGLSGFVNGVLRNVIRNKESIKLPDAKKDELSYLSVKYSHPKWMVNKWLKRYDYGFVEELLKKNNVQPKVTVCVNTEKASISELLDILEGEGVKAYETPLSRRALILENQGSIAELESFRKGLFHVQDIASQLAVEILAPVKGSTVLDICSAPGGKSFLSAYLMQNNGTIISNDIYPHKLKLIEEGAKRLGVTLKTTKSDAQIPNPELKEIADYIIVDAPCSGLGIIRKKPDIKLNRKESDIAELSQMQRKILESCAGYAKKGAYLLYSTCTLTEEENTENARWFASSFDFEQIDLADEVIPELRASVSDKALTLFPHINGTDGFYISKFRRK